MPAASRFRQQVQGERRGRYGTMQTQARLRGRCVRAPALSPLPGTPIPDRCLPSASLGVHAPASEGSLHVGSQPMPEF